MKLSQSMKAHLSGYSFGHHKSRSLPTSPKYNCRIPKRCSQRSTALNSTHSSSTSTIASPKLAALRKRNLSQIVSPDPILASEVVRHYLLPMFEADVQARGDVSRSLLYGSQKSTQKSSLEPVPGTVYGELKLSDTLHYELQSLKLEFRDTVKRLKEAEQRKASAMSDLLYERQKCLELESSLKTLNMRYERDLGRLQGVEMTEMQLRQELKTLQDSYSLLESTQKSTNSLLQAQYARIDKLHNKATEQEHINSLLIMENDIIGERLKGLYFAIEQVADSHYMEEVFRSEGEVVGGTVRLLGEYMDVVGAQLKDALFEKDGTRADNAELVCMRNDMRAERDKIARLTKEKINDLLTSLQHSEDEREKLQSKYTDLDKTFKDLTEEFEKLRQKAKQYRLRRKQYGEEEEKVCKNCQRVFLESENFNWSCRRHQNEYSGEIYWCCGKSNRDAIGCKISKHESREDDDEAEMGKEALDQSNIRCAVLPIQSCRKYGHVASDCPRDPNLRSSHDVAEEIHRIKDINSVKRKTEEQTDTSQAVNLLIEKTGNVDFHYQASETESEVEDSQDVPELEEGKSYFRDIVQAKSHLEFDTKSVLLNQNFIQIEEIVPKEQREKRGSIRELSAIVRKKLSKPAVHLSQAAMNLLLEQRAAVDSSERPTPVRPHPSV